MGGRSRGAEEAETRGMVPLCYAASLLNNSGAGCGNRIYFVSLKNASAYPFLPIPQIEAFAGVVMLD